MVWRCPSSFQKATNRNILYNHLHVPSHFNPCLNIPYSIEPQWSQKVGLKYVVTLNLWGISILNLSFSFCDINIEFWHEMKLKFGMGPIHAYLIGEFFSCRFTGVQIFRGRSADFPWEYTSFWVLTSTGFRFSMECFSNRNDVKNYENFIYAFLGVNPSPLQTPENLPMQ